MKSSLSQNIIALTEADRKIIKYEKRAGYVFATCALFLGFLFNLYYFAVYENIFHSLPLLITVNTLILIVSFALLYFINRKLNTDLKENKKEAKIEKIQSKYFETSYEVGSGAMYIPVLGDLFPRLWGRRMRSSQIYYLEINGIRNKINKDFYDSISVGDTVEMFYPIHSCILLEIRRTENKK